MANSTYSFNDVITVLSFANLLPAYTVNGQGVGTINVNNTNDNSAQDLAADGSVMTSKIKASNGTVAISVQQTSPLHKWLKQAYNAATLAPTALWAALAITVTSPTGTFDVINCKGCSFQKPADQPYEQQGQMVTWNFLASDVQRIL